MTEAVSLTKQSLDNNAHHSPRSFGVRENAWPHSRLKPPVLHPHKNECKGDIFRAGENHRFLEPDGKVLRATAHSRAPFPGLKKVGAAYPLSTRHSVHEHAVVIRSLHIALIGSSNANIPST